jgi:hypothetical protein
MFNLNLIQQHVNSANSGDVDNESVWLSIWFGQLSSKGPGSRCHGVQLNKVIFVGVNQQWRKCSQKKIVKFNIWSVITVG